MANFDDLAGLLVYCFYRMLPIFAWSRASSRIDPITELFNTYYRLPSADYLVFFVSSYYPPVFGVIWHFCEPITTLYPVHYINVFIINVITFIHVLKRLR